MKNDDLRNIELVVNFSINTRIVTKKTNCIYLIPKIKMYT